MKKELIVFILSFITSINMCHAQTLENKHAREKIQSITGLNADFYTINAYDYWIEKPKLNMPANKEKAVHLLRLRTLFFSKEESKKEISNLTSQNAHPAFIDDFKQAILWGEEQKSKTLEDLEKLSETYPLSFKEKEIQDDYRFYFQTLAAEKRLQKR